jgi:methylated-DNA-[protein]-cysteine S-methyltransferase
MIAAVPTPWLQVRVTLFETPIGRCGLAWGLRGIVGVQLPEPAGADRARLLRRFPDAVEGVPPPPIAEAIARIVTHLEGESSDLDSIALDMSGVQEFDRRVYEIARAIPRGVTKSYGEVATELGDPGAARAVGQALGRNPFPIIVPCHRVLAAAGRPGGFSAHGGVATKLRLLAIEGAPGNSEFDFQ